MDLTDPEYPKARLVALLLGKAADKSVTDDESSALVDKANQLMDTHGLLLITYDNPSEVRL